MELRMNLLINTYTIKAGKRHNTANPITAALKNVADGAVACDYTVHVGDYKDGYDAIWLFGSVTRRKPDTDRAISIAACRKSGTPIFSLDSGLFSTYIRNKTNSSESNFFRVGLGDCVGTGDFLNENSTPERFEWFKKAYNFEERAPTKDANKPILFLLQTESGWQYDNAEPYDTWARNTLLKIREYTDRPIVLRAHPNNKRVSLDFISNGVANVTHQYSEKSRQSSIESIRDASAVVTHSSSSAIEAYIEGIPTFALDERCLGYFHLENDLSKINELNYYNWDNRYQHLCDWAMSTWHIEEFKNPNLINYYLKKAKLL